MALDGLSEPRREHRARHWCEEIHPKEAGLSGEDSWSKLASRIHAAAGRGAEHDDRRSDRSAHDPRDEWRQPGLCQREPDQKNDNRHT